jgi:primosomal protein N''
MVFSKEDRVLIKQLRQQKGYSARRLLTEFPRKTWSLAEYRTRIRDVEHLKKRLIEEWSRFDQSIIDQAIGQWRQRLRACVCAEGGHFEQLM